MFTPVSESNDTIQRNVKIANLIALTLAILTLVMLITTVSLFGPSVSTPLTGLTVCVYGAVILLNRFGFTVLGRVLLCVFLPVITLCITILLKYSTAHTDILYYDSRMVLLASAVVPCLVFSTYERVKLYGTLALSLLCMILFDPLHETFGQGYYQKGFTGQSYTFINHVSIITFFAISASALILKIISERAENYNIRLIRDKEKFNTSLKQKNEELELANTIIRNQRNELTEHNRQLEKLVQEKGRKLIDANEELIKHNHELQQFSYTISHNLRGPVARLLGLTDLLSLQQEGLSDDMKKIITLIKNSSQEFDGVIRDLNKIIDVRNDFYRVKEKVSFEEELLLVKQTIGENLFDDITLNINLNEEPVIFTVKPILNSILYNLVSNALKYRSEYRRLELSLRSYKQDNYIVLEVRDNGMGMNLASYGKELFGLYKRFHSHVEGRGLGLYLVKSQIESLGGRIDIESQLNVGTSFFIHFKIHSDIDGQICMSIDCATVFYNARIRALGVTWKGQATSEEYRQVFIKSLEMMMLYQTPYWISDIRRQGTVLPEDQQWMLKEIFPAAVNHGMRKGICLYDPQQHNADYREQLAITALTHGIEILFFQTFQAAEEWIENHTSLNVQAQTAAND